LQTPSLVVEQVPPLQLVLAATVPYAHLLLVHAAFAQGYTGQSAATAHSTHLLFEQAAVGAEQLLLHDTLSPHTFWTEPHALPRQASFGVQPHWFSLAVPPPQLSGSTQLSMHVTSSPQLFRAVPHARPLHASTLSGMHAHSLGDPLHSSLLSQGSHCPTSAQPLLASSGTHLSPHLFVLAPQLPTTHSEPSHTSVPVPGEGHEESQPSGVQPYVGSETETHLPSHFFCPSTHESLTHSPPLHAQVRAPAGHVDWLHVVSPQPYCASSTGTHTPAQSFCCAGQPLGEVPPEPG
jgi:hypothetical protein